MVVVDVSKNGYSSFWSDEIVFILSILLSCNPVKIRRLDSNSNFDRITGWTGWKKNIPCRIQNWTPILEMHKTKWINLLGFGKMAKKRTSLYENRIIRRKHPDELDWLITNYTLIPYCGFVVENCLELTHYLEKRLWVYPVDPIFVVKKCIFSSGSLLLHYISPKPD